MKSSAILPLYNRSPIAFERGEGVWLWDTEGKKYLDAISGIGVTALGHTHPAITEAIQEQAAKVIHTSNGYIIPEQEELALELTEFAQMDMAFFCNSGAEANEAALKMARLYGHQQGIDNPQVIVFENSFHGRTLATLSASGNRKIQAGYEPLVTGFIRAPFNDIQALQQITTHNKNIVGVMFEPILGNGGIIMPDKNFLAEIGKLCQQHRWLLIVDEIQTGIGRTGKNYAYQHYGLKPDVITTAKALGNGIPIAACLTRGVANEIFKPGKHGSTFGGNPFACHVARAVLKTLIKDNIIANADHVGSYLITTLRETFKDKANVVAIRGQGLMIGIELNRPCSDILKLGIQQGLLFNITAENVIRLLPPLILRKEEADLIVERLANCIAVFN